MMRKRRTCPDVIGLFHCRGIDVKNKTNDHVNLCVKKVIVDMMME